MMRAQSEDYRNKEPEKFQIFREFKINNAKNSKAIDILFFQKSRVLMVEIIKKIEEIRFYVL